MSKQKMNAMLMLFVSFGMAVEAQAQDIVGRWDYSSSEGGWFYSVQMANPDRYYSAFMGHGRKGHQLAEGEQVNLIVLGEDIKKGTLKKEKGRLVILNLSGKAVAIGRSDGVIVRATAEKTATIERTGASIGTWDGNVRWIKLNSRNETYRFDSMCPNEGDTSPVHTHRIVREDAVVGRVVRKNGQLLLQNLKNQTIGVLDGRGVILAQPKTVARVPVKTTPSSAVATQDRTNQPTPTKPVMKGGLLGVDTGA